MFYCSHRTVLKVFYKCQSFLCLYWKGIVSCIQIYCIQISLSLSFFVLLWEHTHFESKHCPGAGFLTVKQSTTPHKTTQRNITGNSSHGGWKGSWCWKGQTYTASKRWSMQCSNIDKMIQRVCVWKFLQNMCLCPMLLYAVLTLSKYTSRLYFQRQG